MKRVDRDIPICFNCKFCEKGYKEDSKKLFCNNKRFIDKFVEFYNEYSVREPRYLFSSCPQKNKGKPVKYKDTCKYFELNNSLLEFRHLQFEDLQ